jgi:hypothetical protein
MMDQHLLVGLAQSGIMEPTTAYEWTKVSQCKRTRQDRDLAAETFLRHQVDEAGEIDWRPLETVPDYHAY